MAEAIPGSYFGRFPIGETCQHTVRHTLTEADNLLFSTLTHNSEPLYLDAVHGGSLLYRSRVANSTLILCMACGVHTFEPSRRISSSGLSCTDVRFVRPVFIGDTIRAESEAVDLRDDGADGAVVEFECRVYNQRNELVLKFRSIRSVPGLLPHADGEACPLRAACKGGELHLHTTVPRCE